MKKQEIMKELAYKSFNEKSRGLIKAYKYAMDLISGIETEDERETAIHGEIEALEYSLDMFNSQEIREHGESIIWLTRYEPEKNS